MFQESMKFFQLVPYCLLSLYSCAEVSNARPEDSIFNRIPPDVLNIISSYLKNPFMTLGSLNRYCYYNFPIKSFLMDNFNVIPEFLTPDVRENEPELKLLLPFLRYANKPETFLYEALKNEFFNENKFNVLLPHLMKYFSRFNSTLTFSEVETFAFSKRTNFDRILECEPNIDNILQHMSYESVVCIQRYIQSNPLPFLKYKQTFELKPDLQEFITQWNKAAFALNLPDEYYFGSPCNFFKSLSKSEIFLIEILVPSHKYREVFDRINCLIDNSIDPEYNAVSVYRLLNSIRFGPDDPDIYEQRIKSGLFLKDETALICFCASLGNKIDLFKKLLSQTQSIFIYQPSELSLMSRIYFIDLPLALFKIVSDLHEHSDESFKEFIYNNTPFIQLVSKYYQIVSFQWIGSKVEIVFETLLTEIPHQIVLNRTFDSKFLFDISSEMIKTSMAFRNGRLFQNFLFNLLENPKFEELRSFGMQMFSKNMINGDNLKFIMKSKRIQKLLRKHFDYRFQIDLKELLKVVEEPVVPFGDMIRLSDADTSCLSQFKTYLQLERLETLLNISVDDLLKAPYRYFKYRHVYWYLIKKGRKLPEHLTERNRKFLQIDFPTITF